VKGLHCDPQRKISGKNGKFFAPKVQYRTGSIYRFCRERRRNELINPTPGQPLRPNFGIVLGGLCLRP
jgi:hypothetical protein